MSVPLQEIERLNRLYAALNAINRAVMRVDTSGELLQRVCDALVDLGGFAMAWVGWHEPRTHQLLPIASAGDTLDYLSAVRIYTDDRPEGRGPSGIAFRERRLYVCNDVLEDPATLPWREEMRRRRFRASAVLPIQREGNSGGTLTVYSTSAGCFQEQEISLLEEAAANISFGLINLARDEAHQTAQKVAAGLIEALPGIFYLLDAKRRLIRWNDNFEIVTGHDPAALHGKDALDFLDVEGKRVIGRAIEEVFELGEAVAEADLLSKDGGSRPFLFTGRRIQLDGTTHLIGVGVDLSERRRAESELRRTASELEQAGRKLDDAHERLRQAEKLEAIGRLAGGVAHDFNNMLSVIMTCSSYLMGQLASADPLRDEVVEIMRAGERAATLTQQLLAFSRNQVLQPRVVQLGALVDRLKPMLARLLREDIAFTVKTGDGLHPVYADPSQLERLVMNLVVNARDAMPRGGTLSLELENVVLDAAFAAAHPCLSAGPHVRLRLVDSGEGMDASTLARIFEPFFTTKASGKGTGLGLAMVLGIVQQSGGEVVVSSRPGEGSTFDVYLPKTSRPEAPPPAVAGAQPAGGHETVLLVEDDPAVRRAQHETLRRAGYEVIDAETAERALELARGAGRPIDALITDVVLPGISGPELARQLARLAPSIRVVYVSGYVDGTLADRGLDPSCAFVPKPIVPQTLLSVLRLALGSH